MRSATVAKCDEAVLETVIGFAVTVESFPPAARIGGVSLVR
jgi:hypothetical protein